MVIDAILGHLHKYLKEHQLVNLSGLNINQLIPWLINRVNLLHD